MIVGNTPGVLAAIRVAGPTVPFVFVVGDDPVKMGLVASLNRPEGNLTGVTFFGGSMLGAKRLALLHELVPKISVVAVLLDPDTAFEIHELVETAARALGLQIVPVTLASERDMDAAFDRIVATGAGALLFGGGPMLRGAAPANRRPGGAPRSTDDLRIARLRRGGRPDQLCGNFPAAYRQAGFMQAASSRAPSQPTCRSCNRPNPSWSINLKTAKALGITVPPTLLAAPTR